MPQHSCRLWRPPSQATRNPVSAANHHEYVRKFTTND
jgi:hypothetical protein